MARELGYQPNRAARQVALGRADAVGIVYPPASEFLGNPSFRETLEGLAHVLEQSECDLLLAAAPQQNELRVYDRMVRGRRVDAMVVAHTLREDPRIDYLREAGFPFVAYGRTAQPDGFPWLDFDNEAGSRMAVRRLVALGHRRIAYVHAPLSYNFAYQRHAGYLDAMAEAGIAADPSLVVGGSLDRRAGYARRAGAAGPAAAADGGDRRQQPRRRRADPRAARPRRGDRQRDVGGRQRGRARGHAVRRPQRGRGPQPTPYRSGQTLGEMALALAERKALAPSPGAAPA